MLWRAQREQRQELNTWGQHVGRDLRVGSQRGVSVVRAHLLAHVAAENPLTERGMETARDWPAVLDGKVRNAT